MLIILIYEGMAEMKLSKDIVSLEPFRQFANYGKYIRELLLLISDSPPPDHTQPVQLTLSSRIHGNSEVFCHEREDVIERLY